MNGDGAAGVPGQLEINLSGYVRKKIDEHTTQDVMPMERPGILNSN